MAFGSMAAAFKSPTFAIQLVITMMINAFVNSLWEWATMTNWGGSATAHDPSAWPTISAWRMNSGGINSCLALDMALTPFLTGFLCCLLATDGTQKEVRKKACDTLPPELLSRGWWRFTPVHIRGLCVRSCAVAFWVTAFVGVPSFLLVWAAVQGGDFPGLAYTVFKSIWATLVSGCVYVLVFPSAISSANFPELEFEKLMELQQSADKDTSDAPPLVAQPAFI